MEQEVTERHTEMGDAEKAQKQTNSRIWGQYLGRKQVILQTVSGKKKLRSPNHFVQTDITGVDRVLVHFSMMSIFFIN